MGYIYLIVNTINGKIYIGQTKTSIKVRFEKHVEASLKKRDRSYFHKAIRKYSEDAFSILILEECKTEELNEKEIYYIKKYNATNHNIGYNISIGGNKTITSKITESQILELANKGYTVIQIRDILHTDSSRISETFRKHNIVYGAEKQRISDSTIKTIIDMYSEGYGSRVIANKLNIDKQTVLKYIKKVGILRTYKETINLRKKGLNS